MRLWPPNVLSPERARMQELPRGNEKEAREGRVLPSEGVVPLQERASGFSRISEEELEEEMAWRDKLQRQPMVVQACYHYIGTKHCTLWRDWDISQRGRRLKAAKELANDIKKVDEILRSRWSPL